MQAIGVDGLRVDRPTVHLIADWAGVTPMPAESDWSPNLWGPLFESVAEPARRAAATAFDKDPRDTSTPDAMVTLSRRFMRARCSRRSRPRSCSTS